LDKVFPTAPPARYDLAWSNGALYMSRDDTGIFTGGPGAWRQFWAGSGARRIAGAASGDLAIALDSQLVVLAPDGGTKATWDAPDQWLDDVASYGAERWVIAITSKDVETPRLVVVGDAGTTLLAGPGWPLPHADGPVASAGLLIPSGIAVGSQGDIFVYEQAGIRRVAGGAVTTWYSPGGANWFDLTASGNGDLVATLPSGLVRVTGPDAGIVFGEALICDGVDARGATLAASCGGGVVQTWTLLGDGGVADAGAAQFPFGFHDVAFDDDDGGFLVIDGFNLDDVWVDGGSARVGPVPLFWPTARAIAHQPGGDTFILNQPTHELFRITPAGVFTSVATLADPPNELAIEDGGTVLVTVPNAVLRVRP
jgi:hypothetical protein